MVLLAFAVVGLKVLTLLKGGIFLLSVISYAWNMGQQKTSINLSSSHPGFLDPHPTQHHIRASAAENQQPDHLHRPRLHSMRWVSRRMCDGKMFLKPLLRFVPTPAWCEFPTYVARLQRVYSPRRNRKHVSFPPISSSSRGKINPGEREGGGRWPGRVGWWAAQN